MQQYFSGSSLPHVSTFDSYCHRYAAQILRHPLSRSRDIWYARECMGTPPDALFLLERVGKAISETSSPPWKGGTERSAPERDLGVFRRRSGGSCLPLGSYL